MQDFLDFLAPSVPHMTRFQANTLARLLISFVPMCDFLHRYEIQPARIASFGAGSCSHEAFLADIYPDAHVLALDMSDKYIPAYTREKIAACDRIEFREEAVESMDWAEHRAQYDLVISIQTLEHIEDSFAALCNVASTVASGGHIYIDTPFYSELDEQESADYLRMERARQWETHSHFHLGFSPFRTAERLDTLGFDPVGIGFSSYVKGDSAFLKFIRRDAFKRQCADRSYALVAAAAMYTSLTHFEDMNRESFAEIDASPHNGRPVMAMRVLARKR